MAYPRFVLATEHAKHLEGDFLDFGVNTGFCPGAVIHYVDFNPGALLFVGDGYAAQGDGELTGMRLKTSMNWTGMAAACMPTPQT